MSDIAKTVIIAIGLGLALVLVGLNSVFAMLRQRRLRTDALRCIARQIDWEFDGDGLTTATNRLAGFHIGSIGGLKVVRNLMCGVSEGIAVKVFDFEYVVGSGKFSQTVYQTVIELPRAGDLKPNFFLHPLLAWSNRTLLDEYRDIGFEQHPVFSLRYQVSGNDEAAVRELFTPNVLEFFAHQNRVFVEGKNECLIYYCEGIEVKPEEIQAFVADAVACLHAFEAVAS